MKRVLGILLMAAMLAAIVSGAGPRTLWADEEPAEEQQVVKFEGPVPLAEFLKQVGEHLELPLVWDPKSRALQNKEVVGDVELGGTKEQILNGLRSLLTYYELVLVPVGEDANRKILVMDARQTAAIVKLKPKYVKLTPQNLELYQDQDGLFLTTVIHVEHMENLRDARNALNRIVTGQNIGNVTEVPAARAFVVTDFAPNVVAIYRLLDKMDVPFTGDASGSEARELVFRAVRLEHAAAADVTSTLVQHFGANPPAVRQPQNPRAPQQTPDVPPTPGLKIHADERLNQVLITGLRADVDKVLEVLQAMDQPVPGSKALIQYVRLVHIDARQAAAALSHLIQRSPGAWMGDAGWSKSASSLPVVEAHDETNALLVQAPEAAGTALRRLITEMDQPEPADAVGEAK